MIANLVINSDKDIGTMDVYPTYKDHSLCTEAEGASYMGRSLQFLVRPLGFDMS